jgi:hypothetical protein
MATPFPFSSGNVLQAAQLNAITTLPVSTKTANYTLTVSDLGSRVVMNSGSSTSITVNTSIFAASDVVEITNIGAGVCTITSGTATVTSTGSLALAQNASGKLIFISASAAIYVAGGVAAANIGLVFISGTTFSGASTVSLPASTFSSTYTNYKIIYTVTAASVDSSVVNVRLRASGTDSSAASYSNAGVTYLIGSSTIAAANILSGTSWQFTEFNSNDRNKVVLDVFSPQVAADTHFVWDTYGRVGGSQGGGHGNGEFRAATQFDSLTLFPGSGTITGSYQVYGYAKA